jgi:Ran GTPase-activating protein (RanGAP) involved in mRNA processing and transport
MVSMIKKMICACGFFVVVSVFFPFICYSMESDKNKRLDLPKTKIQNVIVRYLSIGECNHLLLVDHEYNSPLKDRMGQKIEIDFDEFGDEDYKTVKNFLEDSKMISEIVLYNINARELEAILNSIKIERPFGIKITLNKAYYGTVDGLYYSNLAAKAIANSTKLKELATLDLSNNKIGIEGAEALAESKNLKQLTTLDLGYNEIGIAGAEALAKSKYLEQLTTLNLSRNEIHDKGAEALAESESLKQLTTLNLSGNEIHDKGAEALAESKNLKQLTTLALGYNEIGFAGADALAESKNLKQLKTLNLNYNNIEYSGAIVIITSQSLENLTTLELMHNWIEPDVAVELFKDYKSHFTTLNLCDYSAE